MAYVAISRNLIETTGNKITSMQTTELRTIGDRPSIPVNGAEDWVTRALWGEYIGLKDQLPDEWKNSTRRLDIYFLPEGETNPNKRLAYQPTELPNYVQTPPGSHRTIYVTPSMSPIFAPIYEWAAKQKEINDRWMATRKQVSDFLNKCKSLNEAVKLWPDVRLYIDKQYLDRLEQKVEKVKSDNSAAMEALKSIDTDQLVANVVMARMAQEAA